MLPDNTHRTIFWSERFRQEADEIQPNIRRFDEIMEIEDWALAQAPESFEQVPGTDIHIIRFRAGPDGPVVRIAYRFSDEEVTLLSIARVS